MSTPSDAQITLSQILKTAQENYPLLAAVWEQSAREYKTKLDAYLAAGFTPAQAMQLLCAEIGASKK